MQLSKNELSLVRTWKVPCTTATGCLLVLRKHCKKNLQSSISFLSPINTAERIEIILLWQVVDARALAIQGNVGRRFWWYVSTATLLRQIDVLQVSPTKAVEKVLHYSDHIVVNIFLNKFEFPSSKSVSNWFSALEVAKCFVVKNLEPVQ